jgi:predicted Zn-ribbon and HTH transcriptional regulator
MKITFTGSCILIGSCDDSSGTKYIKPLAISNITVDECNYENLNFFFQEQPCTLEVQQMDSKDLESKEDKIVDSFNELEKTTEDDTKGDSLVGDTNSAIVKNCGLEDNLEEFNSMEFTKEGLKVEFFLDSNRIIMI